ncbi:hypothetical protein [Actinoplanes sp. NPDC049802]|uniref:hypothetical protein n=1 Tax=Actinoplanes sp. NPDC049802 TaxID=3154742 RepID=UPI0033F9C52C
MRQATAAVGMLDRVRACLLLLVLLAGCGTAPAPPPVSSGSAATAPGTFRSTSRPLSTGWKITVYYTAVEEFHHDDPVPVTGCPRLDCENGDDHLGEYPESFVNAVEAEGTGKTLSGRFLNWSYDTGFWLDDAPRASDGGSLTPFVSAAADPGVLPQGTGFTIADCGRQEDGSAPPAAVCARLRKAEWRISDEFTPGLGGSRHVDAYIGPETGPGFTESEWYLTLENAKLAVG